MSGYTRLSKILAKSNGNVYFLCPACGAPHGVNCGDGHGPQWTWNNSVDEPTFSPSLHVSYPVRYGAYTHNHVCHSYVTNGKIQFLPDCTHKLAGETVDLIEWDIACEGEENGA